MKLSIIIPTIGRKEEVEKLLQSIYDAHFEWQYEVLIIDQNEKGFLADIVEKYSTQLPIHHHLVHFKGLSKAKNYGVQVSNGEYISFPDDGCLVFPETYRNAFQKMEQENADIVFGKCVDKDGKDSVLNFKTEEYFLNKQNMLGGFVEATVISKREVLERFLYDENMGAGTFFGAEEGFDWLYRILSETEYRVLYSPKILFYHPQVILSKGDLSALHRVFKYRCGTAYLCEKHGFLMKYFKRWVLAKMASYLFLLVDREKAKYYGVEAMALKIGKIFAEKIMK